MKKITAAVLVAKLSTRNTFVAELEQTIATMIIESEKDHNSFEMITPELSGKEIELIASIHNVKVETFAADRIVFALGQSIMEKKNARLKLDQIISEQSATAIAKGENKFYIHTEKDVESQPEVEMYLRHLGFQVVAYNKCFTVSF